MPRSETVFTGIFRFVHPVSVHELVRINALCEAEYPAGAPLAFLEDYSGLLMLGNWGVEALTLVGEILEDLRQDNPAFGLVGEYLTLGE